MSNLFFNAFLPDPTNQSVSEVYFILKVPNRKYRASWRMDTIRGRVDHSTPQNSS